MIFLVSFLVFASFALAQISCPASDQSIYTDPNNAPYGVQYRIECNYDRPHGDMPGNPIYVNSMEECISHCALTYGCVDVTMVPPFPGPCYLKNVLEAPEYKPGQIGAHALYAEGVSCPNPPSCIEVDDFVTCYSAECSLQRVGTSITTLTTTTFQDCINECEANYLNGCSYVTFQPGIQEIAPGGFCNLLSTYSDPPTYEYGMWGAIRQGLCPNPAPFNESTWVGRNYDIKCGADLGGTNIGNPTDATGIYDCMTQCDQTLGCVGADWHFGYPTGPCYLKSSVSGGFSGSNPAVQAAIWLPDCFTASTVTTTVYTATHQSSTTPTRYYSLTPMFAYNMITMLSSETQITYGATPSPVSVPSGPYCYGRGCSANYKREPLPEPTVVAIDKRKPIPEPTASPEVNLEARTIYSCLVTATTTVTVETWSALSGLATASTCTVYDEYNDDMTTVPSICQPTYAYNLQELPSYMEAVPANSIALAPPVNAVNKIDCCDACARIFNCVWWKFDFSDDTDDASIGGTCTFAYNYAIYPVSPDDTPSLCPNGVIGNWYSNDNPYGYPDETAAFYNTGYNPGPCNGAAISLWQSTDTAGVPPDWESKICSGYTVDDYY